MAGQYAQGFNFLLIKGILNAGGDQLLTQGGIAWQLDPNILPNAQKLECRLLWRSFNFTADITLKGILAATPNVTVGTEVFSQTVGADGWNDTGTFSFDTPVTRNWITLVANNPSIVAGARVDECALNIAGLGANGEGLLLSF